ncbi:MAG: substrate-binding domain-containing protein [Clostridia bacterium]|nr:substrate-binding domain-containing protein [Clostridia bacterium]
MVSKIIKIMACLTLICAIISLVNIYDFNDKFNSQEPAWAYLKKFDYHFIAIVPEEKGTSIHLLKEGIDKADKEFNIVTEVYTATSIDEQMEIIRIAQLAQVDGILLWPAGNSGFTQMVNETVEKNIPVVLASVDSPSSRRNSFIGLGRNSANMAATELINAIDGKGEICILSHEFNQSDYDIRIEEFKRIADKYKTVSTQTVFLTDDNFLYEVEEIKKIIQNKPEISAFFCLNSDITVAAASALKLLNKKDSFVMGYEDFNNSEAYISDGELYGNIFENAEFMGYVAVRYLRDMNRNKWVPSTLDPGIKLMTKESMKGLLSDE